MKFDIVTGANVYLNDNSLFGRAEEVSGLSVKPVMKELAPIGLFAKKKVMTGLEALEMTIKWDFINEGLFETLNALDFTIRGNVVREENGVRRSFPVVIEITGRVEENNILGTVKHQEWKGQDTKLTLDYVKVEHDGVEVLEIDVEGNIFKENGVDRLEEMRTNTGL